MRYRHILALLALAGSLGACAHPNVRSSNSYQAIASPPALHPDYDPYAAYGEANATWRPPVWDRVGTIVRPAEPSTQSNRPDFAGAGEWATGAGGGNHLAPAGTF